MSPMERGLQSPFSSGATHADRPFSDAEQSRVARCLSTRASPSPGEYVAMRLARGVAVRARGQWMMSATPGCFPPTLTLVFHRNSCNPRCLLAPSGSAHHGWACSMRHTQPLRTSPGCRLTKSRVLFRLSASERPDSISQTFISLNFRIPRFSKNRSSYCFCRCYCCFTMPPSRIRQWEIAPWE
jgi:hypothetical protein